MIHIDDSGRWTPVEENEIAALAAQMDESTRATWLWALLFGPIYFAVHGFRRHALAVLALDLVVVGVVLGPLLAYPAWRQRARTDAAWLRDTLAARPGPRR